MKRSGAKRSGISYFRRTLIVIFVLVFFVAVVICLGWVTSIKNINVSFVSKTGYNDYLYDQTVEDMENIKGNSLLFLTENGVSSKISDNSRIKLVSFEKVYPCSVDVVFEERVELFTATGDSNTNYGVYDVYDDEGVYMYTSSKEISNPDGAPNILVAFGLSDEDMAYLANVCDVFEQIFSSKRGLIESMGKLREATLEPEELQIKLRTGVVIEIEDCESNMEDKLLSAYGKYNELTDYEKTVGRIHIYSNLQSAYMD